VDVVVGLVIARTTGTVTTWAALSVVVRLLPVKEA
jgi:hypothetical protein